MPAGGSQRAFLALARPDAKPFGRGNPGRRSGRRWKPSALMSGFPTFYALTHHLRTIRPLPAYPTPQPGNQLIQRHIAGQTMEPGKVAHRERRPPPALTGYLQESMGLIPYRIDRLGAGVIGHVPIMFLSCRFGKGVLGLPGLLLPSAGRSMMPDQTKVMRGGSVNVRQITQCD